MIQEIVIVTRYTEAFLSYAKDSIGQDKALSDIKKVKDLMRDNPDFKEFLEAPEIAFVDKINFIDKVLGNDFSGEIKHFLKMLIEKARIHNFSDMAEYLRVKYTHEGEQDVLLKTTLPLDIAVIKKIQAAIEKKFKRKFKFYIDLDSRLLGGIQVIIGNIVIDGSVRRRLDELKEKLMLAGVN